VAEKRMLIVDAEVTRKIEENRGESCYAISSSSLSAMDWSWVNSHRTKPLTR